MALSDNAKKMHSAQQQSVEVRSYITVEIPLILIMAQGRSCDKCKFEVLAAESCHGKDLSRGSSE